LPWFITSATRSLHIIYPKHLFLSNGFWWDYGGTILWMHGVLGNGPCLIAAVTFNAWDSRGVNPCSWSGLVAMRCCYRRRAYRRKPRTNRSQRRFCRPLPKRTDGHTKSPSCTYLNLCRAVFQSPWAFPASGCSIRSTSSDMRAMMRFVRSCLSCVVRFSR